MTPELQRLRVATMIFAAVWFMHALLVQVMFYNYGRQAEAFQARLDQLEAKMRTSSTK